MVPSCLISADSTPHLNTICVRDDHLPAPMPVGPKPRQSISVQTAVNVMAQAMMTARTSVILSISNALDYIEGQHPPG